MITISPFWSLSLDSMPSPNLAHTHFTIYIKTKLFCGRIFQDQARLIVRCALCTLWQKVISASCYLHRHPNISLMCNPCHLCLLASPFHLMCSFNTNDKRSHGSIPAITPHFFSFENNTHQPKGTSSKEVKIRALESKIICSFLQFSPRAGSWLSSTFVCPLKEDWLPTSFSCHVEVIWRLISRYLKYSALRKIWNIWETSDSHEIFVSSDVSSPARFDKYITLKLTIFLFPRGLQLLWLTRSPLRSFFRPSL